MNFIDIFIILFIAMFAIVGFKRGLFKQAVMTLGALIVIVLSFILKNPVAVLLSNTLPFIKFQGLTALNILLYQALAFVLVAIVLYILLYIIIEVTNLFELLLKITIILELPSKILGAILGFIEGYIIVFAALFILNQVPIDNNIIHTSKIANHMLSSKILTKHAQNTSKAIKDIYNDTKNYEPSSDANETNLKIIDTLLKYKLVKKDFIISLYNNNKLEVTNLNKVTDKYE